MLDEYAMTPKEATTAILETLGQQTKPSEILCSQDFCLEDRDGAPVHLAGFLKRLIGKKVASVKWVNIIDRQINPDGTIGHFEVITE